MKEQRVMYYSSTDLSIGMQFGRIEKVLELERTERNHDINDIIELYCIIKIFDVIDSKPKMWSEEQYQANIKQVKSFKGIVGKFCSNINDNNIEDIFVNTDEDYKELFWEILNKNKVFKRISSISFSNLSNKKGFKIRHVLSNKELVQQYGVELINKFMKNIKLVEIILDYHLRSDDNTKKEITLPAELTEVNIHDLINNYIDSDYCNLNYLSLITNASKNRLNIDDVTKFKAKQKLERIKKELFNSNSLSIFSFGLKISIEKDIPEISSISTDGDNFIYKYDYNWLKDNLDFATILNNFIYVFDIVDSFHRFNQTTKVNDMGIFEAIIGIKGHDQYTTSNAFDMMNQSDNIKIRLYEEFLNKNNIYLTQVAKWFFEDYLVEEFNEQNFFFNVPTESSTYREKCRDLCAEMDSILKQFKIRKQLGYMNRDLHSMQTEHISIGNVLSLIDNKYLYANKKQLNHIFYLMFSNQSPLNYFKQFYDDKKPSKNFYELLQTHEIKRDDFEQYQQTELNDLLEKHFVLFENDILCYDENTLAILNDLYHNGATVLYKLPSKYNETVNKLIKLGYVTTGSTLLSIPEQNYYDYLFTNTYGNSLGIRNRYMHGCQGNSEEENRANYFICLRMLIEIIIKINDEFLLYI